MMMMMFVSVCVCVCVQGNSIDRCILMNMMFEMDWILHECPLLARIPVVEIIHGERAHRAAELKVRCAHHFYVTHNISLSLSLSVSLSHSLSRSYYIYAC